MLETTPASIVRFDSGDLARYSHQERITVFNTTVQRMRDAGGLEQDHTHAVVSLEEKIRNQRERADARSVRHALQELATKFKPIHEDRSLSPLESMAQCFAQVDEPGVLSDFDRSMTKTTRTRAGTWAPEVEYLIPNVPASVHFEEHLATHGRESYTHGFVKHMQKPLQHHPYLFEAAGKQIPFRPGVVEFYRNLQDEGISRTIVSANFEPFIRGKLADTHLGDDDELRVIAVKHDDISSKDKRTVVRLLAAENTNRALIFIGDGKSDLEIALALAEDHILAGVFALEGSELDVELTHRQIPHLTYNDFNDVNRQFFQARAMAQNLQEQAA